MHWFCSFCILSCWFDQLIFVISCYLAIYLSNENTHAVYIYIHTHIYIYVQLCLHIYIYESHYKCRMKLLTHFHQVFSSQTLLCMLICIHVESEIQAKIAILPSFVCQQRQQMSWSLFGTKRYASKPPPLGAGGTVFRFFLLLLFYVLFCLLAILYYIVLSVQRITKKGLGLLPLHQSICAVQ